MVDILFFLLLTVFFIFKLKNAFGIKNDEDKKVRDKTIEEFFKEKYGQNTKIDVVDCKNVVDITEKIKKTVEKIKNDFNFDFPITEPAKEELNNIGFNIKNFLKGVENAVEMINEASSNKDEETLRTMLGTKLFTYFKKQIDDLNLEGKTLKSSLISILSKDITNIKLLNKNILIEVVLKMEQINFIENEKKEVLLGSKKKIEIIQEKWTFKREKNSKTNFWLIENIENIENA
ncbi:MAG TPA: Tim44/TimA family putative adaptor protein [Rickettsiales bacterium]|nr:Tim44/TimA family putative adaptor protein [Rickettsiales bacterium]